MAFFRWLAKKGSVGSTARWAANMYSNLNKKYPGIHGLALYQHLIAFRYPDYSVNQVTLSRLCDDVKGLRGFVVMVLTVEAGFLDNTQKNRAMFLEVIDEVLIKHNVPDQIIFN